VQRGTSVTSAPRDPDAAGGAVQRFARLPDVDRLHVCDMSTAEGRIKYEFYLPSCIARGLPIRAWNWLDIARERATAKALLPWLTDPTRYSMR
jgi:hypothetical protein